MRVMAKIERGTQRVADYEKAGDVTTGQRFGMLTVIDLDRSRHFAGQQRWRTRCDCGQDFMAWQDSLKSGKSRSCGCVRRSR